VKKTKFGPARSRRRPPIGEAGRAKFKATRPTDAPYSLFPLASTKPAIASKGAMLDLIEAFDWTNTVVGPIASWPPAFVKTTRLMLASDIPMVMLMGPTGVLVYNNAYAEFAGDRHPGVLGAGVAAAWPEIAQYNLDILNTVLGGEIVKRRNQLLTLTRNGRPEDVWLDLEYSPVLDSGGAPIGELVIFSEITDRVRAQNALIKTEENLAFAMSASGLGIWEWDVANDIVTSDKNFAQMYDVDPERARGGISSDEFLAAVHPEDRRGLREATENALATGKEIHQEYRLLRQDGSVTWVLALGRPADGGAGPATRMPGVAIDITNRKNQESALKESEAKFRAIANTLPQMLWSTLPDGYHDYYNDRWYEFTGVRPGSTDGEEWNGVFHPDDQQRAWTIWRHSLATGEPYRIEYRLRHHSGEYRWTLGQALPIRDEWGNITRWFGSITDIHEDKMAAVEREIVAQELSHRIKNIFSVVNGLVSLTGRAHPELRPLIGELRTRITALGLAHDVIRENERYGHGDHGLNSLRTLLGRLLAPYNVMDDGRIVIGGDDVEIDDRAATPLALLFHELATNAAKYGAMSLPDGKLLIDVTRNGGEVEIDWRETGVGASAEQAPGGFGSRLISLALESQLSGQFERSWSDEGMLIAIRIPLTSLARPDRPGGRQGLRQR
jgi:PAS domain S-box-containing protein